jgi:excisionase family DNA binding protein
VTDYPGTDRRQYLTVLDVAEMWGVSDDKVRADIRKGALDAYTVGGCIRIRVKDALAWGRPLRSSSTADAIK